MTFPPATKLNPYDPSRSSPLSGAAPATRLSPADLAGVISHPKKDAVQPGADPTAAQHQKLVEQSQKWVAQTFFGTLLKQMRDSPFKSDLFDGGRGGQAFSQMYDQKLIEHMSRGAGGKLVKSVVRRIEAGAAYRKQQGELHGDATGPAAVPPVAGGQAGHAAEFRSSTSRAVPAASGSRAGR